MTGNAALVAAIARLRDAGVEDAPRDARRLLAHVLGVEPARLTLILPDPLGGAAEAAFEAAVVRRAEREPVSHITGTRAFYGRDFQVGPDVLDPRPETETLIEEALSAPFGSVLDMGTGSGCILLTILAERPEVQGLGTDLSPAALAVALSNAARLGIKAEFRKSDWFTDVVGRFDLIVSNPPYITADEMADLSPEVLRYEPHMALTPGGDGLDAYRAITAGAMAHLNDAGRLIVEIGYRQGGDVAALFRQAGFTDVRVIQDLGGKDRVVVGRKP